MEIGNLILIAGLLILFAAIAYFLITFLKDGEKKLAVYKANLGDGPIVIKSPDDKGKIDNSEIGTPISNDSLNIAIEEFQSQLKELKVQSMAEIMEIKERYIEGLNELNYISSHRSNSLRIDVNDLQNVCDSLKEELDRLKEYISGQSATKTTGILFSERRPSRQWMEWSGEMLSNKNVSTLFFETPHHGNIYLPIFKGLLENSDNPINPDDLTALYNTTQVGDLTRTTVALIRTLHILFLSLDSESKRDEIYKIFEKSGFSSELVESFLKKRIE